MNRPQRTLATTVAFALVLAGCGMAQEEPEDTTPAAGSAGPSSERTEVTSVDTAVDTEAEQTRSTGEETVDGTSDDGTSGIDENDEADEADEADGEPTAYPSDPVAYADALIAAWAAGDAAQVADLAVEEVELGTGTWSTDPAWEHEFDDTLDRYGDIGEGRTAVYYSHPGGGSMVVTLDGDDLGGEDAVVGIDYLLHDQAADPFDRLATPLNDYVDSFHRAMVDQDEAVLERLGTDRATAEALELDPAVAGAEITDHGFLAFQGEALGMLLRVTDQRGRTEPQTRVLELTPQIAAVGGHDGVVRLNTITSARWY